MHIEKAPASGSITISYNFLGVSLIVLIMLMSLILAIDHYAIIGITLSDYITMSTFGGATIDWNTTPLHYNTTIRSIR